MILDLINVIPCMTNRGRTPKEKVGSFLHQSKRRLSMSCVL